MEHKSTNKAKLLLLVLVFAVLFIGGCKKDRGEQVDKSPKTFNSKQEAKVYINKKLNEYGKILAKYAVNVEMRKLVNNKVAEKFDGDYNVLLKDLLKNSPSEKLLLKSNLKMTITPTPSGQAIEPLNLQLLEVALVEPFIVNGEILYPQIYIPFFEEQELEPIEPGDPGTPIDPDPCSHVVVSSLEPVYPNPVIVAYDGEEGPGEETFTGYTYDQNGLLIENIPVDECFAKRHRVWAVTLNERANRLGVTPQPTSGPTPAAPTTAIGADAYFPKMTIKHHKESWIKGASEVYVIAATSWENGINPSTNQIEASFRCNKLRQIGVYNEVNDLEYNYSIRDFERKEIKKEKSIDIDFTYFAFSSELYSYYDACTPLLYATNNPIANYNNYENCKKTTPSVKTLYYPDRGDYVYFLIYEYDTGFLNLNGYKTEYIPANNKSIKFTFRSNEGPYLAARLKISNKNQASTGNFTASANFDNNGINVSSRTR
ncbi:hypothetical protein [Pedobacter endophyticus]|uniref:Uncharacterized protein n=1 Tax=Pedobacter endophyticus TaxID=2789740 RepID=A0A7S9PYT5_9SPHI|nr:hypothetical protein [Pedobacter endophyticus]QPH39813.1 hypothetical protein IZT61_00575 [Pedobacter endophyticus]